MAEKKEKEIIDETSVLENENIEETMADNGNDNVDAADNNDKESSDATESEEAHEPTIEEQLTAAQAEVEKLKNDMLYKQAEFDNYRKRTLKEKAELILNGGEKTIIAILPVLDDFERAMASAEKSDDVAALREGMDLIFKKFVTVLEKQGVKKIDTKDADFNVDYHEAVAKLPMGDAMKNKVIDCVQTGYTLNDKVIRYAKVAVGE